MPCVVAPEFEWTNTDKQVDFEWNDSFYYVWTIFNNGVLFLFASSSAQPLFTPRLSLSLASSVRCLHGCSGAYSVACQHTQHECCVNNGFHHVNICLKSPCVCVCVCVQRQYRSIGHFGRWRSFYLVSTVSINNSTLFPLEKFPLRRRIFAMQHNRQQKKKHHIHTQMKCGRWANKKRIES